MVFINARVVSGSLLFMDVIFEESNALKRVSYPPFLFMWTLQDLGAREVGPKLGLKSRTGARQLFYRMKF